MASERAGIFERQGEGQEAYRSFRPHPLPPANPDLIIDREMTSLIAKASLAIGRLDGSTGLLPNPDLFVYMYVRREAVLSSQIEGTQSTLEDLLKYEAGERGEDLDVVEVVNYVKAMNYGLDQDTLPLSNRLVREMHGVLLGGENIRGSHQTPGEFRTTQNWIGPQGCTLSTATFVPPTVPVMQDALGDLEKYMHADDVSDIVQAGLIHAQFETIHPFGDGNGRIGRMLITFFMCQRGLLRKPLLYLSYFLKQNRNEYYRLLMDVRREGDWEAWIKFFLRGVVSVAGDATKTAQEIVRMREEHLRLLEADGNRNPTTLLDVMFKRPIFMVGALAVDLGTTFATANKQVARLENLGIVEEVTGRKRDRRYRYTPYLALFADDPLNPANGGTDVNPPDDFSHSEDQPAAE